MSLDEKFEKVTFESLAKEPHLVGLSLSGCIRDIVQNKISVEQVDKIVARTKAETLEHWTEVIETYKITHWSIDPDRAERIVRNLLKLNKIEQPRLHGVHSSELFSQNGYGRNSPSRWMTREKYNAQSPSN